MMESPYHLHLLEDFKVQSNCIGCAGRGKITKAKWAIGLAGVVGERPYCVSCALEVMGDPNYWSGGSEPMIFRR